METPKTPVAYDQQEALERARAARAEEFGDPDTNRFKNALEAIRDLKASLDVAASARALADKVYASAMLDTARDQLLREQLKNDATRKAYADLAALEQRRLSELADGDAKAKSLLANLLAARASR